MSQYPEHEKLHEIADESYAIGAFLDTCGYTLCESDGNRFRPTMKTIQTILAEYFDIDQNRLEQEKQRMLQDMRDIGTVVVGNQP